MTIAEEAIVPRGFFLFQDVRKTVIFVLMSKTVCFCTNRNYPEELLTAWERKERICSDR